MSRKLETVYTPASYNSQLMNIVTLQIKIHFICQCHRKVGFWGGGGGQQEAGKNYRGPAVGNVERDPTILNMFLSCTN